MLAALALSACDARSVYIAWPDPNDASTTLADVEATVSRKIPVPEITAPDLREALSQTSTLTFDVREPGEYAHSRIAGSTRIDPGLSPEAFAARYGHDLRGKTVVFYCAVGFRSGQMLDRMQSVLRQSGARAAYNLRGGIFRWHTSGNPVVTDGGIARSIHPYDAAWGKLLARTTAASHQP